MIYRALNLISPETVKLSYYCLYDTLEQSKKQKEPKVVFAFWGGRH